MFKPQIEDGVKYSKFKILCSLFSKKKDRNFDVFIFDSKSAKASYDKFFIAKNTGYSKRNEKFAKTISLREPIASSTSSLRDIHNKRKFILTYFLPLRD